MVIADSSCCTFCSVSLLANGLFNSGHRVRLSTGAVLTSVAFSEAVFCWPQPDKVVTRAALHSNANGVYRNIMDILLSSVCLCVRFRWKVGSFHCVSRVFIGGGGGQGGGVVVLKQKKKLIKNFCFFSPSSSLFF